jgi:hypothetical protein
MPAMGTTCEKNMSTSMAVHTDQTYSAKSDGKNPSRLRPIKVKNAMRKTT